MNQQQPLDSQQQQKIEESSTKESQIAQSKGDTVQIHGERHQVYINQKEFEGNNGNSSLIDEEKNRQKSREDLIEKVEGYWVKTILEELSYNKAVVQLELEERPDFINNYQGKSQFQPNQARKVLQSPGVKGIIEKFNQIKGSRTLLILGDPTGGKTTILLSFTKHLINEFHKDKTFKQPIPVVFDFSNWNKKQKFYDCIFSELVNKYRVSKSFASDCINTKQLLILLDNLNKLDIDHQNECVQSLNEFNQEHGKIDIVVTCNIEEYIALSNLLDFKSAIYIRRPKLLEFNKIPKHPPKTGIFTLIFRKLKRIKLLLTRFYLLNYTIIIALIAVLLILFIPNPSTSEICNAIKEKDDITLIFKRFVSIENFFVTRSKNKYTDGECFRDVIKEIPNGKFSFSGSTSWGYVTKEIESEIQSSGLLQFELNKKESRGSKESIRELLKDGSEIDFVISSENFTDVSDQDILDQKEKLESKEVGKDAVTVVVTRDLIKLKPDSIIAKEGITKERLKSMYTKSDRWNWKTLRGPEKLVTPYSRNPHYSGTADWFQKEVLDGISFSKNVVLFDDNDKAQKELNAAENEGSIYYASASIVLLQCKFYPLAIQNSKGKYVTPYKLPLVSLDDCEKHSQRNQLNLEQIYQGKYPFMRSLYVIYRKDNDKSKKSGLAFAKLLLTQQGQEILEEYNFAKLY